MGGTCCFQSFANNCVLSVKEFKIVPVKVQGGKRKCIQFTDKQDGTKYALKVINGVDVVFEVSI